MKKIRIGIKNDSGSSIAEANFTNEEESIFKEYLYEVDRVNSAFPDLGEYKISLNLSVNTNMQVIGDIILPDDKDLMALLHLIRPFLLKKEQLHFGKCANLLRRKFNSEYLSKMIDKERDMFNGVLLDKALKMQYDDVLINSDDFLIKYLNAYEYHRDKEYRKYFENISDTKPGKLLIYFIVTIILAKVSAIFAFGNIIKKIFK